MRSYSSSFSGRSGPGPAGLGTQALVASLVTSSVLLALSARAGGPAFDTFTFDADRIRLGEVWRLFTYFTLEPNPLNLLISSIIVWLFGSSFEAMWGTRHFTRFYLISAMGGATLAVPLGMLTNLTGLFVDVGRMSGPGAAIDAMMVALVMSAPDSTVLFGFVLPVKARTLIGLLLGMQVVGGLMTGASHLGMTLGGMIMGYILVSGIWRPQILLARVRLFRMTRRRHLYVVPPRSKNPFH